MEPKKSIWDECTNQYTLQKTLRFELKPIGETLEHIKEKRLIESDKEREVKFNKVKEVMDEYYKYFIAESLKSVSIDRSALERFFETYKKAKKNKNDNDFRKEITTFQKSLRKDVHKQIAKHPLFPHLFKKEFLVEVLPNWLILQQNRSEDLELIREFAKWSTYFTGFFGNRKNVFSEDEIATSIVYRIIHDNLPKYLDNLERFEKLQRYSDFSFKELVAELLDVLNGKSVTEYMRLENFNAVLSQGGIDKYNTILGGKTLEGKKIKGLNEYINLYSQAKEDERKEIRKLKHVQLFKQILSDRESHSFIRESFKNDQEIMTSITKFSDIILAKIPRINDLLKNLSHYDLKQVYVKKESLESLSKEIFDDWQIINNGLLDFEKKLREADRKNKDWLKKQTHVSIHDIEQGVLLLNLEYVSSETPIRDYFESFAQRTFEDGIKKNLERFKKVSITDQNGKSLVSGKREKDVECIKTHLDLILDVFHFVKPLSIDLKRDAESEAGHCVVEIDSGFYSDFEIIFTELSEIVILYDKVRDYVTQKPFSQDKFKLNFDSSSLLSGWGSEFNTKAGLIFRESKHYYLGIVPKRLTGKEIQRLNVGKAKAEIELLIYDFQKPDNKNIPRLFIRSKGSAFAPAITKYNLPVNEILEIYDNGFFKTEYRETDERKFKQSLTKLIDYFKSGLSRHESYKHYSFSWKDSEKYEDISSFYADVESSCYKPYFEGLDYNYMLQLVSEGKLYLFKIWNKDFSEFSKGRKNLHTLYWNELFSEENLKAVVFKLNGEAEIFYREASLPKQVTHPKNTTLDNRDPIKGKKTSTFKYDLIKDERYTEDKFMFHCPITLNFKSRGKEYTTNEKVNSIIRKRSGEVNILSIDRGERHLLYYTLIDSKGRLLAQDTLNTVADDLGRLKTYRDKLDELEKKRQESRRAWRVINNIKELKSGYLSQAVHKISKIAIENNAIIVLEDLNFGFKKGRFKIEKQVYQKFEKALIDKLNFLVFKDRSASEIGGQLKAYQLTSGFKSFKELGKQTGILYYVPAQYTSKICPRTGFVNFLYPRYENQKQIKDFFSKFDLINYNVKDGYFEFTFKYSSFRNDSKLKRDAWTVCTFGERIIHVKAPQSKKFEPVIKNPTQDLRELLKNSNIAFESGENLRDAIVKQDSKAFFEGLTIILKNTLRLRNSNSNSDEDYILSCVKDSDGEFFDSRKAKDGEPKNADANGAYHIGLKGQLLIDKIKNNAPNKKLDLRMPTEDFMNFVLERRAV